MNSSIAKKLALLLEWEDKGFDSGSKKAQKQTEQLKKRAKELAVAMAAVGAAVIGATVALFKFIKAGVQVQSVKDTFDGFRVSAEMSADTLERVNEITRDTISDMDLMNASVLALAGGLAPERLIELWGKAKQMGDVMSMSTLEVFQGLTGAMNKLEVETLKTIGITIRAEDVYKEYALSIGKTTGALTTKDKQTAFSLALEKKYVENFYEVGDVTTRNRELFQQFEKQVKDTRDEFFRLVAMSPAVEGFLIMLKEEILALGEKLKNNEEKIADFTEKITELGAALLEVGKFVANNQDAILALLGGIVATKLSAWILGVAEALGILKVSVAAASGWIGLIVLAAIYVAENYQRVLSGFLEIWDTINRYFFGLLSGFLAGVRIIAQGVNALVPGMLDGAIEGLQAAEAAMTEQAFGKTFIDDIQTNVEAWPEFNIYDLLLPEDKQDPTVLLSNLSDFAQAAKDLVGTNLSDFAALTPQDFGKGGGPTEESLWQQKTEFQDDGSLLNEELYRLDFEAFAENEFLKRDSRLEVEQDTADQVRDIHEESFFSDEDFLYMTIDREQKAMQLREQIHRKAFGAMGQYSDKFFKKGAHMGRVLNAMMIAGFSELAASYIESKTKQSRFDMLEYTYKALAAAASGQWHLAAGFTQAAAGAALVAGAGALAAGYIRNLGQEKADALMAEPDPYQESDDGTTETAGQRRKASGVVNARPIHITVNSTSTIQAGVVLFNDTEPAVNEFYEEYFRDQIQEDIEAGVISIPA